MIKVKIARIIEEADGIRAFQLVRTDGKPFEPYEAGAHIDVTGPTGITRQYSLCSPPDDATSYMIAVKKEEQSRGGSQALHDLSSEGSELSIGTPRNMFGIYPSAKEHVLFGAGIGITPLLSMAYALNKAGAPYKLHYFVRSEQNAAFKTLLNSEAFEGKVCFHYGVPRSEIRSAIAAQLTGSVQDSHVYTCGPAPFMDAVVETASMTRDPSHIHLEHFQASELATNAPKGSFEVRLAKAGKTIIVSDGTSLADALERNGCMIDTSCREGICGTCIVQVLEGEPEHRDNCLSAKEKAANDQICACVSRAKTGYLVLDL